MIECRQSSRWAGFTLIELLIVVLLLAVITGIAVPNFCPTDRNVVLRKTAEDLLYTMRYAQNRAVTKRRVHQVQFDARHSQYRIMQRTDDSQDSSPVFEHLANRMGRAIDVPEGIAVTCDRQSVNFYPDGTIEKVRVFLTAGERTFTVSSMEHRGQVYLLDFKPAEI